MKNVYAITSGEYSDYSVHCVCPTKEDADQVAEKLNSIKEAYRDSFMVLELPMVTGDIEKYTVLYITEPIYDNGVPSTAQETEDTDYHLHDAPRVQWRWFRGSGPYGTLHVWGRDVKRVRKVFSEKRAAIVAAPDVWREIKEKMGPRS